MFDYYGMGSRKSGTGGGRIIVAGCLFFFFIWLGAWRFNISFNLASFPCFLYWVGLTLDLPLTILIAGLTDEDDPWLFLPYVLTLIVVVFLGLGSSALFNAEKYASQIDIPEARAFVEDDIAPFDPAQIPWVSEEYAKVLGDKLIGTLGAVGSSVELGEYVRQDVNGELFFVAPILHSGFWKYRANPSGTAGYVMVSMTDDNDVRLVSDFPVKVQPAGHAAWDDKLERIIFNAAPTALRFEYKFEIDNEMHPWWVVPIYQHQVGLWDGAEIVSLVLVDATDGNNVEFYQDLNEVPEWVDRVYPEKVIEKQIERWGKYSGGFWNTIFSRVGLLQSDEGNSVVYYDDDCYLFDSLTSYMGADESTVGFVLTNMRTKETRYFSLAGATEFAACHSAQGDERVKAQNYDTVFPLPTMIEGQPTYFIPLADQKSNIVKSFALVNIERHHVVGIGTTIREVERDYRTKLRESGSASLYTPTSDLLEVVGEVLRWNSYVEGGNTYYEFVVKGYEQNLFLTDASDSEAIITREGDMVRLQVVASENAGWTVFSFDNLEFSPDVSDLESELMNKEYYQRLEEFQDDSEVDNSEFAEYWKTLTPEQQEQVLVVIKSLLEPSETSSE